MQRLWELSLMINLSILRSFFKVLLSSNAILLVLNPAVIHPYYLWRYNFTILICYFEDFANYSLYELRMKLFFKTYRFRDFLVLLLRLMFFWRLLNHSISINIAYLLLIHFLRRIQANLIGFIVRAILFLFLGEWLVSEGILVLPLRIS